MGVWPEMIEAWSVDLSPVLSRKFKLDFFGAPPLTAPRGRPFSLDLIESWIEMKAEA